MEAQIDMVGEAIKFQRYPDGRLDVANASIYMGLAEKTLAMMRTKGTGPKYIKRGKIFYFLRDIDEWISEGESLSTAQNRQPLTK